MSAVISQDLPNPVYDSPDLDEAVLKWWCEGLSPPHALTVSQWADKYRRLGSKSSSERGPWRTDRTPYLREIMDKLGPHDPTRRIVFMKASQIGGTECGNNWIGYAIHHAPAPMIYVMPRRDDAKYSAKARLDPLIEDTPELTARILPRRSRDSGNTQNIKEFPGGLIRLAGANSAADLKSMPARYVFADEVDEYPPDLAGQGDPLSLIEVRTRTFPDRKFFEVSSPTIKDASAIERDYELTDKRRYFVPCPHCKEYQVLRWSQVQWQKDENGIDRPDTAVYVCEHCGSVIEEHNKPWMLANGEWRATAKAKRRGWVGYHLSSLYSPLGWLSWADAAELWIAAHSQTDKAKHDELLKIFINTVLAETWEERGDKRTDADTLKQRREPYDTSSLPASILALTAGVDVQDDRLEVEVVGWGTEEESWGVAYITLTGDPAKPDVWARLDKALTESYMTEDGRALRIRATAVDSGGHHTQETYQFCTARAGRKVWAIKGREGAQTVWPRRASKSRKHKHHEVRIIGVDTAKDTVYSRWAITESGPGYCHLPDSYTDEWCQQATVENRITKRNARGKSIRMWVCPSGRRNEASDCRVYAYAALVGAQQERVFNLKALAQYLEQTRTIMEEESIPMQEAQAIAKPKRQGRSSRFRFIRQ